jgi:hypothetical protein
MQERPRVCTPSVGRTNMRREMQEPIFAEGEMQTHPVTSLSPSLRVDYCQFFKNWQVIDQTVVQTKDPKWNKYVIPPPNF